VLIRAGLTGVLAVLCYIVFAESVLAQLAAWIDDYNRLAPHSALGMRSPADYRAVTSASGELTSPSV
jgi:Integrase core domain